MEYTTQEIRAAVRNRSEEQLADALGGLDAEEQEIALQRALLEARRQLAQIAIAPSVGIPEQPLRSEIAVLEELIENYGAHRDARLLSCRSVGSPQPI